MFFKKIIDNYSNKKMFILLNILLLLSVSIYMKNFSFFMVCGIPIMTISFGIDIEEKNYIHIFLISIVLIMSVFLLYYGYIEKYGAPYYLGGSDDLDFEVYARYVIKNNSFTPFQVYNDLYWYVAKGFVWILSLIMRFCDLFGSYHTIIPRLLNIYCLLIVGILSQKYYIKKCSNSHRQSLFILYFVTLFPNTIYLSSNLFRDIWVLLGIFLIFYIYDLEIYANSRFKLFLVTLLISGITYFIRSQSILIILAEIFIILILKNKQKISSNILEMKNGKYKNGISIVLLIIILPLFLYALNEVVRYVNIYSEYLVGLKSGLSYYIFKIPLLPFGIIFRFLYGLVSPFPNGVLNLLNVFNVFTDIEVFYNTIISIFVFVQILLIPYLFLSFKKVKTYNLIWLLIFLTVIVSTFTFRHFLLFYPFMWLSIFECYFSTDQVLKKRICKIWIPFIVLLGVVYLAILNMNLV